MEWYFPQVADSAAKSQKLNQIPPFPLSRVLKCRKFQGSTTRWRWSAQADSVTLQVSLSHLAAPLCSLSNQAIDFPTLAVACPHSSSSAWLTLLTLPSPEEDHANWLCYLVCTLCLIARTVTGHGREEGRCLGHSGGSLDAVKLNLF